MWIRTRSATSEMQGGALATLWDFDIIYFFTFINLLPIPVAAQSKMWVCGRSHSGIVGSNPAGGMDVCLL
jgi:hypothetical protein